MLKKHSDILTLYYAHQRKRPLRKGATLLEMSIWLLIFVGIVVAVLAIASMVLSQNTAAQETQTVTQLTTEARKLRTARGYTNTLVEDMRSMRAIPNTVMDPGTGAILYNSWGGEITFGQLDGGANFTLTYTNIPQAECIQLVQSVRAGVLQSIAKGGNGSAPTHNIINLTPSVIESDLCSEANANNITWSTKVI